jgi:hypothetical protein
MKHMLDRIRLRIPQSAGCRTTPATRNENAGDIISDELWW